MSIIKLSPFDAPTPSLDRASKLFNFVPITVSRIKDNRISETHWHDYLQIWYTVSGEYTQVINGVRHPQTPGSATLIFPYTVHSIDSSNSDLSNLDVISISIKKGELEKKCIPFLSHSYAIASFDSFYLSPVVRIGKSQKETADILCHDLLSEANKNTAMFTTKMFSAVARFLEICIDNAPHSASEKELVSTKEKNECIDAAMQHILEHRLETVSIKDLSTIALMSRHVFTDTFRSTIGRTCHDYLMTLKLSAALSFLRYTDMSIAEVADASGFANASHLYRNCIKTFGMSPIDVRRTCGKWAREYGDELFRRAISSAPFPGFITDNQIETHKFSLTL